MLTELHSVVRGKVQGVGYRDFVVNAAEELGLMGYVRNIPDGGVEVVAQGYPDTLKEFVTILQKGSVLSDVVDMQTELKTLSVTYDDFHVL